MAIHYGTINPCAEVTLPSGSQYFSRANRDRLQELLANVTEDDARKILDKLLQESTKENTDFTLSEAVTNAIILMNADACVEGQNPPTPPTPPSRPPSVKKRAAFKAALTIQDSLQINNSSSGKSFELFVTDDGNLVCREV